MEKKYYKIGDVPFMTNAIPPEGSIEIKKKEHDELALASVKPEPVFEPQPNPLEEKIKKLEEDIAFLKTQIK